MDNDLDITKRIDYVNYVLGYIVFNGEPVDNDDVSYLVDWFNHTDFTNLSNSDRRKIFRDLILRH